jgi:hypothetical protein
MKRQHSARRRMGRERLGAQALSTAEQRSTLSEALYPKQGGITMTFLSIHKLSGNPDDLLQRKQVHMDPVVRRVAPEFGAIHDGYIQLSLIMTLC